MIKHSFLTAVALLLLLNLAFAKTYLNTEANKIVTGADKIIIDDNRNTISFIHFNESQQPTVSDYKNWLKSTLKVDFNTDFVLYKTDIDQLGWTNYRFKQTFNNVIVENGVFYVHVKNGKIISANGELYSGISVNTTPGINLQTAITIAETKMQSSKLVDRTQLSPSALVICQLNDKKYILSWKIDVYSSEPMKRSWFYIDATNGKIVNEIPRLYHIDSQGTAVTGFNGTQTITTDSISPTLFRLQEYGRGGGIWTHAPSNVHITDNDNYWNNTQNYDNFATDAHWSLEKTYDFYMQRYNHNSHDNNGMLVNAQVHDGLYVNAYWTGTNMAFGDGDGVQYYPLTSTEIVGHEFTHGVTEFTAGLLYQNESGALNESFSDIFGVTVRFLYSPSNVATWFIGDQMVIPNMGGQPFRNMANPNQFQCADTYGGLYFNNGDIVHYDSGIQNFWYYLLTSGGTGVNDIGNNYNVTAIGLSDASDITFRNLATYLTPNSTFADARTYAEQAAIDLFGQCSNQVIQTANAWYAVGVGGPFSGTVVANFFASPAVSCSAPASVSFVNTSFNATTYSWDFGDGNNSTQQSPTHIYQNPGVYNVTLYVTGTGNCVGADTLTINSAVTINNFPGPIPAQCNPNTVSYCCGYGIYNVTFNTINWTSNNAIDGYSDFTCADSSLLTAGDPYIINVSTNPNSGYDEKIKVWIDYNNDGQFNNTNELVYTDNGSANGLHSGIIYTSAAATLNTRLRMRIISDAVTNNISSACYTPVKGQVEDYMLYFVPNSLPPIANFTSNITTVVVGGSVNFNDLSIHVPTAWNWTFTGGSPSNSTTQNPTNITYNTAGVYPVKLVVTNNYGADSVTQITYIHVVNAANMCQNTSITSGSGVLYDSGGPTGNYVDYENCSFLINPNCVQNLTLHFVSFNIENGYDYLKVYDGPNINAPLLGNFTGNTLPPNLTSTSGKFFIVFTSDYSVVAPGFEITWNSTPITAPPVANFSSNPNSPVALIPVQFTDLSTNSPNAWLWNFGDNGTSTFQNPIHTYLQAGTYTVTLIATNCFSSDTFVVVKNVTPNGVEEKNIFDFVNVYPNPTNDNTTISFSEGINWQNISLTLNDITGRKLTTLQTTGKTVVINMNNYANGVYLLDVQNNMEGKLGTIKIIVFR